VRVIAAIRGVAGDGLIFTTVIHHPSQNRQDLCTVSLSISRTAARIQEGLLLPIAIGTNPYGGFFATVRRPSGITPFYGLGGTIAKKHLFKILQAIELTLMFIT